MNQLLRPETWSEVCLIVSMSSRNSSGSLKWGRFVSAATSSVRCQDTFTLLTMLKVAEKASAELIYFCFNILKLKARAWKSVSLQFDKCPSEDISQVWGVGESGEECDTTLYVSIYCWCWDTVLSTSNDFSSHCVVSTKCEELLTQRILWMKHYLWDLMASVDCQ